MRAILPALSFTLGCAPLATSAALAIDGATFFAGDQQVEAQTFMQQAERSAAICVGEQHDDAKHHRVQSQIFESLAERSAASGVELALGMEMFRRRMQPALNAYFDGEIDSAELAKATDWDKTWGFDFAMYQPMLETARRHRARIIGLNASRSLTRAVSRRGLEALPADVRDSLPALQLDDAQHRKFFWAIMGFDDEAGDHGHGHAMNPERFYTAQVIWDETMAESVSSWLSDPQPRQMMVVAGNGHCHRSAVPNRVERRHGRPVMSVMVRSHGDDLPAHAQSDFVIEVR
jgi:uncharacterized iron-regulated protein